MSVDPDLAETDQPYAYAGDDPVNTSDPSGLHQCNGGPWTWGGCVLNVADSALPRLIESVSWSWDNTNIPCPPYGWRLTVNPTVFGRYLWYTAFGPAGFVRQAWSQTVQLANDEYSNYVSPICVPLAYS